MFMDCVESSHQEADGILKVLGKNRVRYNIETTVFAS
jgi:hypothetical protein